MTLQGKGFFILNLPGCEGGEPASILAAAQAAGLSHIIIKIADGIKAFGINASGVDLTAPLVQALRAAGIAVWGWQPVYGSDPSAEAAIAVARAQALSLDGYVVEVGDEYQRPGMATVARQFMQTVRSALHVPIALRSYGFPNYHPALPWATLLEFCDLHMPKVYWEQAHAAGVQLRESRRQWNALPNAKRYIATGATYTAPGWTPAVEDINDFLHTAQALDLPAVNFFDWEACRTQLPLLWKTIASFAWPTAAPASPSTPALKTSPIPTLDVFLVEFLEALNSRQAALVAALYDPVATQVWADQILRSAPVIQANYAAFFTSLPDGAVFTISAAQVENDTCLFAWKAASLTGETTLVLKDGKIILEYTFIA